jgi:hypothetical protein
MSETIDQKAPLSPNDPAYYAPRTPRDLEASRLPRLGETNRPFRAPATSITDTTLDGQLENAVRESLSQRHPLDPEAMEEPPEMRGALLGVVGRFAAAVGAAAFVALLFVIVIPSLRQQSADPSAAEVIDSMKSALMKSEASAKPREAQPSPELQSVLAASPASAPVNHEESEVLLKQFMQWQQKPADSADSK